MQLSSDNDTKFEYKRNIPNVETWEDICYSPSADDASAITNCQAVKLVWLRHRNEQRVDLYFINSKYCNYHYDFVAQVVHTGFKGLMSKWNLNLLQFNNHNYRENPNREFVLLTIVKYCDMDKYALEMCAEDDLPAEELIEIWKVIHNRSFFRDKLYFRPTSNLTESTARKVGQILSDNFDFQFSTISSREIFGGAKYIPYNLGSVYGFVKFLRESNVVRPDISSEDIVIADFVPNDIPPCAAIITSTFQAPLCHISILCKNRKTPNMYARDIFSSEFRHKLLTSEQLSHISDSNLLSGAFIHLSVEATKFDIHNLANVDHQTQRQLIDHQLSVMQKDRPHIIVPKISMRSTIGTCPSTCLTSKDWIREWVGEKAYSLREFEKCWTGSSNAKIFSEGFVVPFYVYFEHLSRAFKRLSGNIASSDEIGTLVAKWIDSEGHQTRKEKLNLLCSAIQNEPVDPGVFKVIVNSIAILNNYSDKVILRSSTNAEDLIGFNGAGLYLSEIASISDQELQKQIVKRVWASVWSERAYSERSLYHIDHGSIGMAILIQPLLITSPDTVKGVCLTRTNIRADFNPILVNVQLSSLGDVTDSKGGIPEQFILYKNAGVIVQEVLSRSSSILGTEQTIMNDLQVSLLYKSIVDLRSTSIAKSWNKKQCCGDVEFLINKIDDKYHLHLVQIRPYLTTADNSCILQ